MIELDRVSKRFSAHSQVVALDDVSLFIPRGQMVSITGPSGSGKSTLLNVIGALDRATSGTIAIDGHRLDVLSDDGLSRIRRESIGFIFQFFNLLSTLSALDNVALPLLLRGTRRRAAQVRARELLELVGLHDRMQHLPDELSGGQRQRIAIARALVSAPPVLLADEPTGNLDTHTTVEILDLIRDLHTRLGVTVVMVTHDSHVAQSCERSIAIRDGRIVDDSIVNLTHDEASESKSPLPR
jgi:ABC-type lipoprotein export system ATPase subunit